MYFKHIEDMSKTYLRHVSGKAISQANSNSGGSYKCYHLLVKCLQTGAVLTRLMEEAGTKDVH